MSQRIMKLFLVEAVILALLFAQIKVNGMSIVPMNKGKNVTEGPDQTTEEEYITEGPDPAVTTEEEYITEGPDPAVTTEEEYITEGPDPAVTTEEEYITEGPDPAVMTEEEYITDGPNLAPTTDEEYVTEGPDPVPTTEKEYVTEGPDSALTTEKEYVTESPDPAPLTEGPVLTAKEYVTKAPDPLSITKNIISTNTCPTTNSEYCLLMHGTKGREILIYLIIIGILIILCSVLLVSTIALAYQVSILKARLKKQPKRNNSDFVKGASLWSSGPSQLPGEPEETNVSLEEVKPLQEKKEAVASKDDGETKPLI